MDASFEVKRWSLAREVNRLGVQRVVRVFPNLVFDTFRTGDRTAARNEDELRPRSLPTALVLACGLMEPLGSG